MFIYAYMSIIIIYSQSVPIYEQHMMMVMMMVIIVWPV